MSAPSVIERVKTTLVALKMPRALEVLDVTLRGIERGEIGAVAFGLGERGDDVGERAEEDAATGWTAILTRRFSRVVSSSVSKASMASTARPSREDPLLLPLRASRTIPL